MKAKHRIHGKYTDGKLNDLKSENEKLKTKMKELYEYQIDPEFVQNELVELEDRSRMCNLRTDGAREKAMKRGKSVCRDRRDSYN